MAAESGSRPVCTRQWGFIISTQEAEPAKLGCLGYRHWGWESQGCPDPGQGQCSEPWRPGFLSPLVPWRTSDIWASGGAGSGERATLCPFPLSAHCQQSMAPRAPAFSPFCTRLGGGGQQGRGEGGKGQRALVRCPALTSTAVPGRWAAADSHPGWPQRPQPAAPAGPPRGVGSGGGGMRGGAESTFPLKPRRNVGGFPEIRPWPPAGPPAPHLDLLPRELQEGRGGSPGGPRSSPPSAPTPQ